MNELLSTAQFFVWRLTRVCVLEAQRAVDAITSDTPEEEAEQRHLYLSRSLATLVELERAAEETWASGERPRRSQA